MPAELKDAPQTQAEFDAQHLSDQVKMLGEDQSFDYRFADRMLRTILTENRQPNFTESTYFKSKLGWDQAKVNRERRRIEAVARLQMVIGTASQREELAKEKETACEIAEKEIPKLEQQIEKLNRQRNQLERAASNATRRHEEVGEAMKKLRSRELLRHDVAESFNERVRHFGETVQSKINKLLIEISHRENCLNRPDGLSEQSWLDSIRMLDDSVVRRDDSTGFVRWELVAANWPAAQARMQEEIQSMRNEISALELQRAAFDEEQKLVAELYISENE